MATVNIGNLTFTHRGDYAGGTAYAKNDVVYYATNGNAYIAKQATTGNAPTNATYWSQFAQGSGGIWNAGLSLGSAGQVVKVNSGANALEFGDVVSKILGTSFISYVTRFTPPQSPSSGTGYANTINIFPTNTFQYTKTIQNSHLMGWLVVSGKGGGQTHHSRGIVSFSTDGSTLESKQNVGTGTSGTNDPNHTTFLFKVANNVAAGTITIDPRYGGNGNRWWDIVNPNGTDHSEYDNASNSHMFIMEVAN